MFRYFLPSIILVFGLALLSCGQQRFFRPVQTIVQQRQPICVDCGPQVVRSRSVVVTKPVTYAAPQATSVIVQPPRFDPLPEPTIAPTVSNSVAQTSGDSFRQSLLSAAIQAANKNEIKRVDVLRLRVALMSPAFRQRAEDLALTQMYFHAGELAIGSDGTIDRVSVDWSRTIEFLAKLIPLILELLKVIG